MDSEKRSGGKMNPGRLLRKLFPGDVLSKLRGKFVLINMTIVTLMLVAIFLLVYQMTGRNLRAQSEQFLRIGGEMHPGGPEEGANFPGRDEELQDEQKEPPAQMQDAPGFSDQARDLNVQLPYLHVRLDESGEIMLSEGTLVLQEEALSEIIEEAEALGERGILSERNLRFSMTESPMGRELILVDISSEIETLKNLRRTFLIIGAGAFLVFLLISIFLARWAVRPVENAWKEQRQFVSDASHELKTPLTVILSNAEMLRNPSFSAEEKAQFTENILTESRAMRTLTENLLSLARADNDTAAQTMTRLNLSELAEDAALPFEAVFFEKGLLLETECEADIFVRGAERSLRECVGILLDNALKYADPNTTVRLSVKKHANSAFLTVSNIGLEIPEETLKQLFKRFYRASEAREADGSYGLGLSILESTVLKHGGRTIAESRAGTNTFGFRLPTTA